MTALREYTSDDCESCMAIFESNLGKYFAPHERQEFLDWLNRPGRPSYSVVERGGEIVACGGIYHDDELNVVGLAWGMVRRDLHRQGLGKVLAEHRVKQMAEQYPGLDHCLATSQHTYGFYEKMGFEVESVKADGFYDGIDRYDMIRPAPK